MVVLYFMTILMLNLLVGILSEKLGDIMEKKIINSYKSLLERCIENETFSILLPNCSKKELERGHLVYATGK